MTTVPKDAAIILAELVSASLHLQGLIYTLNQSKDEADRANARALIYAGRLLDRVKVELESIANGK